MNAQLAIRLLLACCLGSFACDREHGAHSDKAPDHEQGHDHAEEHPQGHNHHEPGHGHDVAMLGVTKWSDEFELFLEYPPASVGTKVDVLAHVTVLKDFSPLGGSRVHLELQGPTALTTPAVDASRPGIFELAFTPVQPGKYSGKLMIEGAHSGVIDGLELEVFADGFDASQAPTEDSHAGTIELLKEQQWGVPFATAFAELGSFVEATRVSGIVTTPPGGVGEVGAPVAGRVVAPGKGLPRPGELVKKNQLLASLVPAPAAPEAAARASLSVVEAKARAASAQAALERARRLIEDDAIPRRDLEEAEREAEVAREGVTAAERAAALFSGARSGTGGTGWALNAPISGVVTQVAATPGASVSPGDVLFRIVDTRELWISARVPEQEGARLRADRDAFYRVAGLETWSPIRVSGESPTAEVVSVGKVVDPVSRTIDVIYALRQSDPALRVGAMVDVSLPSGADFSGLVVPAGAVVNDDGREVVYVQVDGEHFSERIVRTGARSGELVGILRGVAPGERLVTRGAHLVRLADKARSSQPHGHVH